MNEPTTKAGRALLAREAYNSRSFDLITADAILAIEAEASALAAEPDAPFPFVGADGIPYYPDYDTPSLHRREQVAALASREPDDALDPSVVWRGLDREHLLAPVAAPLAVTSRAAVHAAIERIVENEIRGVPGWRSDIVNRLTDAALAAETPRDIPLTAQIEAETALAQDRAALAAPEAQGLDVERLRAASIDVEAGYILMPDRTALAYWRKVAARFAVLAAETPRSEYEDDEFLDDDRLIVSDQSSAETPRVRP